MMKRIFSLLLLVILTITVACTANEPPTTEAPGTTAAPASETTGVTEAETTIPNVNGYPVPQIQAQDYTGKNFNILGLEKTTDFLYREFVYDDEMGAVINDAIFKRNNIIQNKYGITITQTDTQIHSPGLQMLQTSVLSRIDEYQAAAISTYLMMQEAQNGHLTELSDLPYVDTDAPWFYDTIQKNLSIGGKEYLLANYTNMRIYDSSVLMYYSKNVAEKLELNDFDQLALDGKWTFDKLREYCTMYGRDVNNDGSLTAEDETGLITHNGYILSFFVGMGGEFVKKDAEDIPVYLGIDEKNEKILSDVLTFLFKEPDSRHGESGKMEGFLAQFAEDRALFTAGNIYYQRTLSDNEVSYGVLPYPKFDLSQDRYYVHTHSTHSSVIGVPTTNQNLEMTGKILADLSYLSYEYIYPAHVEKTMQYRYAADETATKLLQMTFDSLVLEMSTALNLKCDSLLRQLGSRRMTGFTSVFDSVKNANLELIRKYVDGFSAG